MKDNKHNEERNNNINSKKISRRDFFKTSALGLFLASCKAKDFMYNEEQNILSADSILNKNARCPLCNIGCELNLYYSNKAIGEQNIIKKASPSTNSTYTKGRICIKGISVPDSLFTNRLKSPVIEKSVYEKYKEWKNSGDDINKNYNTLSQTQKYLRDRTLGYNSNKKMTYIDSSSKIDNDNSEDTENSITTNNNNRVFIEISQNEALELIRDKTIYTLQKLDSNEIYSYSSSSIGIESHYAINKFMRGVLYSPNLDNDIKAD
ncbi:MAG: hypothetical protein ACOCV8_03830, partial [Spirochaetota bacterium]